MHALTHDVQRYNIDNENSQGTNYVDVFKTYYSTKSEEKSSCLNVINPMKTVEDGRNLEEEGAISPVQRVYTCPSIDYTADTFRSKVCLLLFADQFHSISDSISDRHLLLYHFKGVCRTAVGDLAPHLCRLPIVRRCAGLSNSGL